MAKLKKISYNIVKKVAHNLIQLNGSTTNLDIKNELRLRNYMANQSEISDMMTQISNDEGYHIDNSNGNYRVFSFQSSNSLSSLFSSKSTSIQVMGKVKAKDIDPITSANSGDWKVSSTDASDIFFFSGKYKRYTVRYRYAMLTGVHYHSTRSNRVK